MANEQMPSRTPQPVQILSRPAGAPSARVALIRPPVVVFPRSFSSYGPVPPIGLAYIAAVLRECGHDVSVIDAPGEAMGQVVDFTTPVGEMRQVGLTPEEVVARLPDAPDLIGITHMFLHEWPQVREVAERARERFPDVPIVVGGENATAFRDEILGQCAAIDACILGEGEGAVAELAARVAEGLPWTGMSGIAVRDGDAVEDAGLPTRMRRLDEVPRPAWDLFPVEGYLSQGDYFGVHRGRAMPILATRGCPYKCSFCSSPQMWTTRYIVRDPDDVADEIAGYVEEFGAENINLCDLTAATKRTWTLSLCDAIERRGLDIAWQMPSGTRAEALDREVLQRLRDTGCHYITFAPESGSTRMLEVYDKRVKLDTVLRSVRAASEVGIHSRVNIIIGHPAERWADLLKSWGFLVKAARAGADDTSVIMFSPYPGSRDFDDLVASGRHVVDEAAYYVGLARTASGQRTYNEHMGPRQLRLAQMGMLVTFYGLGVVFEPKRLVRYVSAQRTGEENSFVDQMIRIKLRSFKPQKAGRPRSRRRRVGQVAAVLTVAALSARRLGRPRS